MARTRGAASTSIPALALGAILAIGLVGCCTTRPDPAGSEHVYHVVVCWLREPGDAEARQQLIETSRRLQEVPGVIRVVAGEAVPSEREVVDDSFDVAVVMTFADAEAMQAYLADPRHRAAVRETLAPLVGRMVVYDLDTEP